MAAGVNVGTCDDLCQGGHRDAQHRLTVIDTTATAHDADRRRLRRRHRHAERHRHDGRRCRRRRSARRIRPRRDRSRSPRAATCRRRSTTRSPATSCSSRRAPPSSATSRCRTRASSTAWITIRTDVTDADDRRARHAHDADARCQCRTSRRSSRRTTWVRSPPTCRRTTSASPGSRSAAPRRRRRSAASSASATGSGAQNSLSLVAHDLVLDRAFVHGMSHAGGAPLHLAPERDHGHRRLVDLRLSLPTTATRRRIVGWNGPGPVPHPEQPSRGRPPGPRSSAARIRRSPTSRRPTSPSSATTSRVRRRGRVSGRRRRSSRPRTRAACCSKETSIENIVARRAGRLRHPAEVREPERHRALDAVHGHHGALQP